MSEIENKIVEVANQPKKVETEVGKIEQHEISELIMADKYLATKQASRQSGGLGIKLTKISPDGTF